MGARRLSRGMPTRAGAAHRRARPWAAPARAGRAASSSERRGALALDPRAYLAPPSLPLSTYAICAAGVLPGAPTPPYILKQLYDCASSILRMRPIVVFAVTAGGVLSMYAPPAITFRQEPHFQMPVAWRLTLSFPQKTQLYFECCDTSIFLMFFRIEAPYRLSLIHI